MEDHDNNTVSNIVHVETMRYQQNKVTTQPPIKFAIH
jgi:hypothetical protein